MTSTKTKVETMNTTFDIQEPIEIRFHGVKSETYWQLLASPVNKCIKYHLKKTDGGSVSESLSNLVGETVCILPMKAYDNWQNDVIEWVSSLARNPHMTDSATPIYKIDVVL